MRRTPPPAPTASMPWAVTILPAQTPRRGRTPKTEVTSPAVPVEPVVGPVAPVETVETVKTVTAPPVTPVYVPPPAAAYSAPPPPMPAEAFTPNVAVDRFGIPIAPSAPIGPPASGGYPATGYAPTGYAPGACTPGASTPGASTPGGYLLGGYPPHPQPPGGWAPPPQKKGWPVIAKVGVSVVSIIAVLVVLAVVIPVFVDVRQKPANRPVTIPATLLGQSQIHSAEFDAQVGQILTYFDQRNPPWQAATGSFYGADGIPLFFLGAAKLTHKLDTYQEREFFAAPDNVTMQQEGSGPYGGKVECGPLSEDGVPEIVCGSVDNDAVIVTVTLNSSIAEAATITREAVSVAEGGSSAGSAIT
jgi:hypothetical protein